MNHSTRLATALCLGTALVHLPAGAQLRTPAPAQQALDQAAFQDVERALAERLTDIESVVVAVRGRVVYEFYRDGQRDRLRPQQSVLKSALSLAVGVALGQGKLASLDQTVVSLMPEWAALNSDPRAATVTVRHLLTMTAGFGVNDPAGITGGNTPPATAWGRPLAAAPGEKFAYDNALIPMMTAVLEKAVGMPVAEFNRLNLVEPLQAAPPSYERGLNLRTIDMAKLGQLALQDGMWEGRQIVPAAYLRAATSAQNSGGPPASVPYGYMWWVFPARDGQRAGFMASGYAGQMIWVEPGKKVVVATTSSVSAQSQQRGHTIQLLRAGLVTAAEQAAGNEAR